MEQPALAQQDAQIAVVTPGVPRSDRVRNLYRAIGFHVIMTVSTSENGAKRECEPTFRRRRPESPAQGLLTATSIHGRGDLTDLPVPHYLCVTPFWFRLFVAALMALAAVLVSVALAHILFGPATAHDSDGGLQIAVRAALAILLCGMALRFCNPLDRRKWFRFALTRDGVYFPGRGASLVFVPWSALVAIDIERWYGKRRRAQCRKAQPRSRRRKLVAVQPGARIEGKGRVRCISVHVVDMTGDEIAARIRACQGDSPGPRR